MREVNRVMRKTKVELEAMTDTERGAYYEKIEAGSRKRFIQSLNRDLEKTQLLIGGLQIEIVGLSKRAAGIQRQIENIERETSRV